MALYTETRIKPPLNAHLVNSYHKDISLRHIRQNQEQPGRITLYQKTKVYGHLFETKCHSNEISFTLIDRLYNMFH